MPTYKIFPRYVIRFLSFGLLLCLVATLGLSGCMTGANYDRSLKAKPVSPSLADGVLTSYDGTLLNVRQWVPDDSIEPRAVIIALHGMNDYSNAFAMAADYWAKNGIIVYALDQRGFGALQIDEKSVTERWPGMIPLAEDLRALVSAVRAAHPGVNVHVLGHSMGGGVVMLANAREKLSVDSIILASPAIWGGSRMPLFYRMTLSVASTFAPGKTLTGARARRQATDNIPVLRGMQADPLVVKATPLRSIRGIVELMGAANRVVKKQSGNILYLYGCRDEIIPVKAMNEVGPLLGRDIDNDNVNVTTKIYPDGWHLLFRDQQAEIVWRDVADWVRSEATTITTSLSQRDDDLRQCEV